MRGRRLGRALTAHVRTWRPYTLWYVGLVGLAGHAIAAGRHGAAQLAAAWAVPTLIWVAAHYLGDYLDRELDAISKPQRPIPAGLIRPRTAVWCGTVLATAAAVTAAVVNYRSLIVAVAGIGGAMAYNGLFKAKGLLGNLVRGSLTGAALVFGAMTASAYPPVKVLVFVPVFWAHDAASNLVGTLRDVSGDRAGGYATFAVRHGLRTAVRTAVALYALAVSAAVVGILTMPGGRAGGLVMLLVAAALGGGAFGLLYASGPEPSARLALRSHEVLVVERMVLAAALLVPGFGGLIVIAVLVPLLAVTFGTQQAMRSRYEFPRGATAHPDEDAATAPAPLS
ncbi:UbiA family prenyltransferase [Streptomyces broussonetiae]|uniref:Ubiquinone biosynthesis protein UbiA n=1 Tax=Streptomyces broussonetiae TaxID=2686304 RepID=A0A6I6MY61_9ACTN|nr:UbiA family prenyltransferase [Streptomyces broussonetiae]QHA03151.1 ubiquinone biosynthesis protein UbiA [Streptomyces broussonetiae]